MSRGDVAILRLSVVGGGFLRTGCGPGPLEPDLDNPSEGNTAVDGGRTLSEGAAFLMMVTVNGKTMEIEAGTTVEGLLAHLGVPRQYTAVAVNRDITPKSQYAALTLGEGDRVEIVRPMGGGA